MAVVAVITRTLDRTLGCGATALKLWALRGGFMSDCLWERSSATGSMTVQRQQATLCACRFCALARTFPNLHKRGSPAIVERQRALAWQPSDMTPEGDAEPLVTR